ILLQARWKKLEGTVPYNLQLWQEVLGSDGSTSYEDAGMLTIDPAKVEGYNRNGGTADERLLLSETVLQLAHATMAERNNTGDIDYHSEFDRLNSELEKVIAGDGSTVFNLYYDLGKAVVTFERGGYYDERTDVYHDFVRDKVTDTLVYSARVGTEITVPNMAQPGYILLGYTTGRSDLIEPNTTMVLKDDLSLTAQWVPDDNTPYAIHHYVEKPEGGYELHHIDTRYGTTDTTVSATDADWRTFEGYDAMKGSEINLTRANIAGNGKTALRLYYKISRYTVTFDLNNIWINNLKQPITIDDVYNLSAADLTQNVAYGKLATKIEPLYEGYAFLGWYTDKGDWYYESAWGEAYDFSTPVTGDITLYARWDTAQHTLGVYHYLMRPDGTYEEVYEPLQSKDGKVFKTGDTITLSDLVKEEYLADGTLYYQPESTTVAGTKAETYTIPADYVSYLQKIKIYYDRYKPYFGGWDFNGGTLTDNNYTTPGSVYVGADLVAPALKRDGYTLIGWAPKLATDPKYTGQMPHAAQVVYVAQWEANGNTPYTVHIYQENAEGEYALKETK
ncbi:MAG: InlB B-repeat-containing protein, partial [Clostridia bacterium]|nr:InlB B-repeat-containing protein [Clostridia bacterium]